jgi:Leucine-rich repeat (LRR) protein
VPEELASNAATLQRLKLPRNKIEKLPACMPSLTALQQIDLSGNKFTVIPEIFA